MTSAVSSSRCITKVNARTINESIQTTNSRLWKSKLKSIAIESELSTI